MRYVLLLLTVLPTSAVALDRIALPYACRVERQSQALSACLDHEAARLQVQMAAQIAAATSDLQAATGPELRAFDLGLRNIQDRWQETSDQTCATTFADDPASRALCRLEAARLRSNQLAEALEDRRVKLGANPLIPIPDADEVELLIPLELPAGIGGPDSNVRVPLTIPVRPQ